MAEVAQAYVSLIPTARGFGKQVDKQIGGDTEKSGRAAGSRFGRVFASASLKPLRAFGAAAVGLFAIDKVKDFFAQSIGEARESQKVGAITAQVIKSTGGAAKVTATQVGNLSTAISNKTGIDDEAIQSASNLLLTFTNVRNEVGKGNDVFNQATQAATDLGAALGTAPKAAAIQLGKALNDPVKGVTALSRVGVSFTAQQKAQIATLVKSGNTLGAQKIILKELNKEFGGAAAAASTNGEKLSTAFANFKEQVGTALLPVLDRAEKAITTRVIPAVSAFVTGLQDGTGAGGKFRAVVTGAYNALSPLGKFITGTVVPAVRQMFAAFTSGGGAVKVLSTVATFVQTQLLPAFRDAGASIAAAFSSVGGSKKITAGLSSLSSFLTGTLAPAALATGKALANSLGPAIRGLGSIVAFVIRNFATFTKVAVGVAVLLIPHFIRLGVEATASAAKQVAAWLVTSTASKRAAASSVIASYKIVAGWIAQGAAAIKSGAETVAVWALYKAEAIKGAAAQVASTARIVASWVLMKVTAAATAAQTAAIWVASTARTAAALAVQGAAFVAQRAIQLAGAVATGVMTAAQWALNAALTANPIGLVVIAIAALVAGLIFAYKHSETFRNIVNAAFAAVKAAASAVFGFLGKYVPKVFGAIVTAVRVYVNVYRTVVVAAFNAARAVITATLNGVRAVVRAVWGFISGYIRTQVAVVRAAIHGFTAIVGIVRGAFESAKAAAVSKMGALVAYVKGIPHRIVSAFGNVNALLHSVGSDIVSGLVNGIEGSAGRVLQAGRNLVAKLPAAVKKVLNINSPSKVMIPIGHSVGEGLVKGMKGSADQVRSTSARLADIIVKALGKKQLSKTSAHRTSDLLAADTKRLTSLAKQRAKIADRLTAAKAKLSDALTTRNDYAAQIKSNILGEGSILNTTTADGTALTSKAIIAQLQTQVIATKKFAANLLVLRKQGLNKTTYQQLLEAGVEQGGATAAALVGGGKGAVGQVNTLTKQLATSAGLIGKAGASRLYQAGVDSARGLAKGLESQSSALTRSASKLAKALVAAVKKALGIKSPSRVFANEVGKQIPAGITRGIDSGQVALNKRVASMVRTPKVDLMGAGSVAGSGATFNQYGDVYGATPQQIVTEQERRRRLQEALHPVRVG